jgi:uncharacterized protein YndB with AHSA1/START domain
MPVDVQTEIEIERPRHEVARFAADPDNAPRWYVNIKQVEWQTAPQLAIGSRVAFVARFLGRRMAYTYEIVECSLPDTFIMRTAEGPFPMETTYTWQATERGTTRMTLRNRGEPTGFSRLASLLMVPAMRRANRSDLALLKSVLEAEAP